MGNERHWPMRVRPAANGPIYALDNEAVRLKPSVSSVASSTLTPERSSPTLGHKLRLASTGVVVVLGGSFHFGYQISLINPMADVLQSFLQRGLSELTHEQLSEGVLHVVWASVAGLLFAGALLGAVVASSLLEHIGARRSHFLATSILCSSFCMAAGSKLLQSPAVFILARFLSGVGIGLVTIVQTVYLTEISPTRYRGFMGTLTGFSTSVGFVVASGVGLPHVLGSEGLWHWAYLVECVPSLLLFACLACVLPDSPVYALWQGREAEAVSCLSLYHPRDSIDSLLLEFRKEIAQKLAPPASSTSSSRFGLVGLLSRRATRQALIICMLLNATVSFSGILAISFFGTFLLQGIGFSETGAAIANCFASLSGIVGNVAGSLAVDKLGRRPLIIGGLSTLALLNALLMLLVYLFHQTANVQLGYAFLAIFALFLFTFSFGVGPMAWFLATELSASADRPVVQSLSVSCQYLTCFISPLLFFPLYHSPAGVLSFVLFIAPLLFTATYLWVRLPETRGKSIGEIVDKLGGVRRKHEGVNNPISPTHGKEALSERF